MNKAHNFLCSKSRLYHTWHHHPHHKKVHVGVLAVSILVAGALLWNVIPHNAKAASTFLATWDSGSSSFDASNSKGNGDATVNGATIVTGYDSSGGLSVQPKQSIKFATQDNIDLSRSLIQSNFKLGYSTTGTDINAFKFANSSQFAFDTTNSASDQTVVYIADTDNNRIVRMVWDETNSGTNKWEQWSTYGYGGSGAGQFSRPTSIVFDQTNQIAYVADKGNCRVVRMHWNGIAWDSWHDYGYCGGDEGQFTSNLSSDYTLAFDGGSQTLLVTDYNRLIRIHWDSTLNEWADWNEVYQYNQVPFGLIYGTAWDISSNYVYFYTYNVDKDEFGTDIYTNRIYSAQWSASGWTNWSVNDLSTDYNPTPGTLAFDPDNKLIYLCTGTSIQTYSVDKGVTTAASSLSNFGNGTDLVTAQAISYDSVNDVLYLFDKGNSTPLIRVHKGAGWDGYSASGASSPLTTSFSPKSVGYDSDYQVLFAADYSESSKIYAMHLSNGMIDRWYSFGGAGSIFGGKQIVNASYDGVNKAIYIYANNSHIVRLPWDNTSFSFGTPVDYTLPVSVSNMEAIHIDTASQYLYLMYDYYSGSYYQGKIFRVKWNGTAFTGWGAVTPAASDLSHGITGFGIDSNLHYLYFQGLANDGTYKIYRAHWNDSNVFDSTTSYAIDNANYNYNAIDYDSTNKVLYFLGGVKCQIGRATWNAGQSKFDNLSLYGTQGSVANYGGGSKEGQFRDPSALSFDPATTNLYIADFGNKRIAKVKWNTTDNKFEDWYTYNDPYHYIMATNGQYPMWLRLNIQTSRIEYSLARGSKEIFLQTDPIQLDLDVWYKVKVVYDSTNGKLELAVYDASGSFDQPIQDKTATGVPWTAPTSTGSSFYIGSDSNLNLDQHALGGVLDNFAIESMAPPPAPTNLSVSPAFYTGNMNYKFSWEQGEGDGAGDIIGYEYQINNSDWGTVSSDSMEYVLDSSDNNDPRVVSGKNTFKLKAAGKFGNYSQEVSINFYFSNDTATRPFNFTVSPSTEAGNPSLDNDFTLTYDAPTAENGGASGGDPSKITYYYAVDDRPTSISNSKATSPGQTTVTGIKATVQDPSPSVVYMLSKGENGLINWDACDEDPAAPNDKTKVKDWTYCATAVMYVKTAAPGWPTNLLAKDTSNKDLQVYEDVLRWDAPTQLGAGIDKYEISRSDDNKSTWSVCGETSEKFFYQTGLESKQYYYRVRARDVAHSWSDYSDVVSILPTGKFTQPAAMKSYSMSIAPKSTSATVKWTTEDTELKNVHKANSYVEYGTAPDKIGKENGGLEKGEQAYVDNHEITLTGLEPDKTKYYFKLVWYDEDGNKGEYQQFDESKPFATVFETGPRPTVTDVTVTNRTLNSAIISYKTSIDSTTEIVYGLDRNNLLYSCALSANGYSKDHVVSLPCPRQFSSNSPDKLSDTSTYYYQVMGHDTDGEPLDIGAVYDFQTLTMPKIAGAVTMDQDKEAPTTTYRFSWKTNVKTTSVVNYIDNKGKRQSTTVPDMTFDHNVTVSNLADQSVYSFEITGVDENWINVNNPYNTQVTTPRDSRPPKVANMTVEVKSSGFGATQKAQLVVTWETDEPGTSQVEYDQGISGDSYANKSKEDMAYSTSHAVILADLEPSKIYHLRAVSKDESGNEGRSEDTTTITGRTQQSVLDIIINSLQKSLGWMFGIFSGQ